MEKDQPKKKIYFRRNGGYSLVEMLVYVGIFASIIVLIFNVIVFINKINTKIIALSQIAANSQGAMDRMIYEIQNSEHIYLPTSNLYNYSYDVAKNDQLSLVTAIGVPANEELAYLDFYVENNTLFLKKDGSAPIALTSANVSVTGLNFYYYKNDYRESIGIDLSMRSSNGAIPDTNTNLVTTVALRSAND